MVLVLAGCTQPTADLPDPSRSPAIPSMDATEWLVLPDGAPRILLVIHSADGYQPLQQTVDDAASEFERLLGKPVDVEHRLLETDATSETRWDPNDIWALAAELDAEPVPSGYARLMAAVLPGCADYRTGADGDDRTCIEGGAFGPLAVIMPDERRQAALDPEARALPRGTHEAERYLLIHEVGHVIGLVNKGIPATANELYDSPCGCHSTSEDSIMYGVQRTFVRDDDAGALVERFEADNFYHYTFGADDLADVEAFIESHRSA